MTATSVGIVGANSSRSWAALAHIPALASLPQLYSLDAVATSRPDSAAASKAAYRTQWAFDSGFDLIDSDVDLVVIAVRVPHHLELLDAALTAGKQVYCEWPLVRSVSEAVTIQAHADEAGHALTVGLQGRFNPAVQQAATLIADGSIGELTSISAFAARGERTRGGFLPDFAAYTLDATAGAGALEVGGGHVLDVLRTLIGDIASISANTSIRRPSFTTAESREAVHATAPDHILAHFTTVDALPGTLHLFDGRNHGPYIHIVVSGTAGSLVLTDTDGGGAPGLQIADLSLYRGKTGDPAPQLLWSPTTNPDGLSTAARNVQSVYREFATGKDAPTVSDAIYLHEVIEAIKRSATTGTVEVVQG